VLVPKPKDPKTLPIRSKLDAPPDKEVLFESLEQAEKNVGRIVELTWLVEVPHTFFKFEIRSLAEGGEPIWTLYKGPPPPPPGLPGQFQPRPKPLDELWTHCSGDVGLILRLVLDECGGTMAAEPSSIKDVVVGIKGGSRPDVFKPMIFGVMEGTGGTNDYSSLSQGPSSQGASSQGVSQRPVQPQDSQAMPTGQSNLDGDLQDMPVPGLLQSCGLNKMTGCLHIVGDQGKGEVFFYDGTPMHANTMEATGDQGMIELITWEKGNFKFFRDEKTKHHTVTKRLDTLLMEGVALLDQSKALQTAGFKLETYPSRKLPILSETQFDEKIKTHGVPVNMAVQKQLFTMLDGCTSVLEILRKRPLPKTEWVPLLFNLLICDLVNLDDKPARPPARRPLEAVAIDHAAIQQAMKTLVRAETNLFTYPIFLFLLEQEFFRFERSGAPFGLVIFEAGLRLPDGKVEALSLPLVQEMTGRIKQAIRNTDVFGHYETFDYALLLPQTDVPGAILVARRLVSLLSDPPLQKTMRDPLVLAFGVAGVPEDGKDLGLLLSATNQSKNLAKRSKSAIVSFKSMRESETER
jgi:hypothetical protein